MLKTNVQLLSGEYVIVYDIIHYTLHQCDLKVTSTKTVYNSRELCKSKESQVGCGLIVVPSLAARHLLAVMVKWKALKYTKRARNTKSVLL